MALPPILYAGSQYLKDLVVSKVVTGKASICLAISEPSHGVCSCLSCVCVRVTARVQGLTLLESRPRRFVQCSCRGCGCGDVFLQVKDGDYYVVNGLKKIWSFVSTRIAFCPKIIQLYLLGELIME